MPPANLKINRLAKIAAGGLLALALALGGYAGYALATDNFHTVVPGQVYRSGQMDAGGFSHCIQRYGIKSILNLRGENPATSWHQAEIATAEKLNVVHYDRSLGSGTPLTLEQMDDLVNLLRQAPKPVLIHCNGGADRSGLVSALYCFAIDGEKPEQADKQLTIWYGHVPFIRPKVIAMDNSFWCYVTNHVAQTGPDKPAATAAVRTMKTGPSP
jgi:protein tyrosine/serine phosphatase